MPITPDAESEMPETPSPETPSPETPSQGQTEDKQSSFRSVGDDAIVANEVAETQVYLSSNDVVRVLDEYLEALKAGNAPSREELLARYPELSTQLDACLAGLTFLHSANHGSLPSQLGDFRIVREVGRGGMGAVFEAIQVSLGRRVALKVLRFGSVSDKEAIERFQREAETVATLHHTNIVPIYFVGSEKGVNYYAMQFIEGRNLAEVMSDRGVDITPSQVAGWALQAAEALSHAHRRGVIHRDVKPSNLILDKDDRLWLTDFGLARRQDDVTLSLTGMLLGTPRYMSPEHASASTKRIDHRSDLFSLGVTLYELLAHRPAFSGDAAHDVIHQILVDQPPPIRQLNSEVPRDFETIVMKCMAKEPDARYASADDMAADLRALIEDRPIRARRASPIEQATRWIKQNHRSVSQLSTAVMLTLVVTLTSLLVWSSYRSWNASAIKLSAQRPPLVAEIISENGETIRTETLPMQNPIDLPAGPYDIRVSADGMFSQNFSVDLDRGNTNAAFTVNVNDQWLTTPQAIEHSYDTFDLGAEHAIVKWNRKGITVQKLHGPSFEWALDLSPETETLLNAFPAYVNPKRSIHHSSGGLGESNESRPWIIQKFVDVNQDGVGDLICAARHQAWVMAMSGAGDGVLWFMGLGEELTDKAYAQQATFSSATRSTVLQPPLQCSDIDGDGMKDMVVSVLSLDKSTQTQGRVYDCNRWLEAISTKTGKSIWRYEIPRQHFAISGSQEVPYDLRWFPDYFSGRSSRGGQTMHHGLHRLRTPSYFVQTGDHAYRPTRACLLSPPDKTPEVVALVAGDQLIRIRAATGEPVAPPYSLGFYPGTDIQWVDVDGDGISEVVTLEEIPTTPNDPPDPKLLVWSIAKEKILWSKPLDAYWPRGISETLSRPQWPLVVDLDADGKSEIIVPHGRTHTINAFNGSSLSQEVPRGKLVVLEGESGSERWNQSIITLDASIDYFLDGPDLDEDGVRELYVASFDGQGENLHVDAFSGNNGKNLWGTHKPWEASPFDSFRIMGVNWWNSGPDGWPQLLVTLSDQRIWTGHDFITTVAAFSAGTGKLNSVGRNINECTPVDLDHDNVEELLVCSYNTGDTNLTLHAVRGIRGQPWKRLGELGDVTTDLNGDTIRDLVESWGDGTLVATDGATGKELWRTRAIRATSELRVRVPNQSIASQVPSHDIAESCDLNQDGYQDLIVFETHTSGQRKAPMHAISGKTGSLLWSLQDVQVKSITDILSTSVADIDHDGEPEVLCLAAVDYGYPPGSQVFSNRDVQLWLFVAEGKNGKLCWANPLSPAYGTPAQAMPTMQLSNFRLDLAIADLDEDQVHDLIVPAVLEDGTLETRALSGRDGKLLWVRQRQPDGLSQQSLENWTTPSFSDFDGNGRPEIVMVEPQAQSPNTNYQRVEVAITLLNSNGEEQWMKSTGSVFTHFNSFSSRNGDLLRPIAIHAQSKNGSSATKTSGIAFVLPGDPKLVVVNGDGKFEERKLQSPSHDMSRVFALDIDDDGTEELFFVDGDFVASVKVENLDKTQWKYGLGQIGQHKIIGIREANEGLPPLVIAQTDCTENRVIALHAKTGGPVWTCAGPIARADDMSSYVVPEQVAVLGNTKQPLPLVFFKYGFINDCRQSLPAFHDVSQNHLADAMLETHRTAAHLSGIADDPRLKRSLPWASEFGGDARMIRFVVWGCFFSLTMVFVPFAYLFQLVERRRFQLSYLMLLPVVAAIFLHSTIVTAPEDNDFNGLLARLSIAAAFTPPLVAIMMIGRWIVLRQRRHVAGWLSAIIVCSLLIAAISITISLRTTPLVENQYFDRSGWYLVFLPAAYTISWVMILFVVVQRMLRGVISRMVLKRPRKSLFEPTIQPVSNA